MSDEISEHVGEVCVIVTYIYSKRMFSFLISVIHYINDFFKFNLPLFSILLEVEMLLVNLKDLL